MADTVNDPLDGVDDDRRLIELNVVTCLLGNHELTTGYEVGALLLNPSPRLLQSGREPGRLVSR
jgi:hypothetical protein